ncbi:MAG: AI-2E family transporter [Desulfobacterales bacterium]|jgi:predicted PurR-regulated permease PerM
MNKEAINKWVLLVLVILISALFLSMIRQFLMAIFLAAIISALSYPLYNSLKKRFRGKSALASMTTVIIIVCVIFIPLAGLIGIVTAQAIKVGETVTPWVEQQLSQPDAISNALKSIPFIDEVEPYTNLIMKKAGDLVSRISGFIINKLSKVTLGTVNLVIMFFIMLYCMFFFLIDGRKVLEKILYYLPLQDDDERRMLDKFTSVTLATLKGTLVIGFLQGGLAGLAFALVGIPSAVFWGTIMAVFSIIPTVGSALVWGPAAIILVATGHMAKGIGLAIFCAVVVGSLDNLLRPILVGKDTQMHELMILFGTLGGILMFGVFGMVIGPIVAALFVTVWEIYGVVFKDILPAVKISDAK